VDLNLAGKVAVVTGAGKGIGKAVTLALADEGAQVVAGSLTTDTLDGLKGVTPVAVDLSAADGPAQLIARAIEEHGRVDILVNNVGIGGTQGGRDGPAQHADEVAFDKILEVNLKGMWLTTKAAIPVMREQGGGAIVNISSLAAYSGGNQVAYEVSKAGVNRLTTSVAGANAKYHVRCNAVLPGLMDTPMAIEGIARATGRTTEETRAARNARVPMGQMGTAWDTAHAALFLASDDAKFITGMLLVVDGGMYAR